MVISLITLGFYIFREVSSSTGGFLNPAASVSSAILDYMIN